MEILLTPQILGTLIDQGYTYALAKSEFFNDNFETIHLSPLKEKPKLPELPEGYNTFYKLTHEPLQMLSSSVNTRLLVDLKPQNNSPLGEEDYCDDHYFRYSEDFFEQVLDSIQDYAVFTTNRKGEINSWNSGAEHLFKYAKNEILGLNVSVLFIEEDASHDVPAYLIETALKEGKVIKEEFHICKDGNLFWARDIVFPLFDEQNRHKGFTNIIHNLEEKKQSRNQAIEALSLASNIIETTKEPVVILDQNLSIKTASKSFYKLFRLKEEETHEKNFYSLTPGLDQHHLSILFNDILPREHNCKDFELRYVLPSGKSRILLIHAKRVISAPDNCIVNILSIEDITEERILQQEKDDFISIATHELKTPVTVIKASAQVLQRINLEGASPIVKKYLQKIEEQSEKLVQLSSLLLDVSRLRSNKLHLEKDEFDIAELVEEVVEDFRVVQKNHEIDIEELCPCLVVADKVKITQVLNNLLSNAIKYSPDSNKIVVRVFFDPKSHTITVGVQDFGIGIPLEEKTKIFKRFSRTSLVGEKNISGNGLGLYITAEIVRRHKGHIWFESEKNKGAKFFFSIPAI
ncbi:PAS domain S-box protein [Pedobacter sp. P351]|uniref:PAS domain-containing sensor histidine kinase n=1 Tax=Pedobacter superstes TaxID=3133441 RepID=UPI0030A6B707